MSTGSSWIPSFDVRHALVGKFPLQTGPRTLEPVPSYPVISRHIPLIPDCPAAHRGPSVGRRPLFERCATRLKSAFAIAMLACAITHVVGCARRGLIADPSSVALTSGESVASPSPTASPRQMASPAPTPASALPASTTAASMTPSMTPSATPASPAAQPTLAMKLGPRAAATPTRAIVHYLGTAQEHAEQAVFFPFTMLDKAIGYVFSWLPF